MIEEIKDIKYIESRITETKREIEVLNKDYSNIIKADVSPVAEKTKEAYRQQLEYLNGKLTQLFERKNRINEHLDELHPTVKQIVIYRFVDNLTWKETADKMNLTVRNCQRILGGARKLTSVAKCR